MNRNEAILALEKGEKLTHTKFDRDEWVVMSGSELRDGSGNVTFIGTFWSGRTSEGWQEGWSVFGESALDKQVDGEHYKNHKIQPIEYIHANNIGFCEGNIIKYVSRWRDKNGLADLEKAKHYIELLIQLESDK